MTSPAKISGLELQNTEFPNIFYAEIKQMFKNISKKQETIHMAKETLKTFKYKFSNQT